MKNIAQFSIMMAKVVPLFDPLLCWTEDVWADSLSLVLFTWYQFGFLFDPLTWFPVCWVRSVWLVLFCWGNDRWSRAGWNRMCSSDTGTSQKSAKDFSGSSFWLYWGDIKLYGLHLSCCQISLYWELRQKWEKSLKYFTHIGSSHENNWHAWARTLIKSSWINCSSQCLQRKGESPLTLLSTQTMVYSTKDQNPNQNERDKSGGQTNTLWRVSKGEKRAEIQVSNRCHSLTTPPPGCSHLPSDGIHNTWPGNTGRPFPAIYWRMAPETIPVLFFIW